MTTYTDSLRIARQATAENTNVWGSVNNAQIDLLDTAIAGAVSIDVTAADVVLTANNGAADQARAMTLLVVGAPGVARVITVPKVQKLYTVHNASGQTVTVKTSTGTGLAIPTATRYAVFVDADKDQVFGFVQNTTAAVPSGPDHMTTLTGAVVGGTGGTTAPTYYSYLEGGLLVVGTDGFTVTVNSIAFFVAVALPNVSLDLDTFTFYISDGGVVRQALASFHPDGVIYSRADTVAWTSPSSRIVPPHYFTMRAAG